MPRFIRGLALSVLVSIGVVGLAHAQWQEALEGGGTPRASTDTAPAATTPDFCVAVNGGFGAGGTTFVGKRFTAPLSGKCKPWAGIMFTATTVVGTSTGTACLSNDSKLLTMTLQTTAPEF